MSGAQLVTPDGVELLEVAPRSPDASRSAPSEAQRVPLPDPDDYDTWCENASVCSRSVPDSPNYISETKGNAAYGNEDGYIGSFDHIVRTNLNGRSPRWTVTYIHDDGPTLTMSRATMWCRKDVFGFDPTCGFNDVGSFSLSSTNRRYSSGLIQGPYLSDSAQYYGTSYGQYSPSGYDLQLYVPNLETRRFNCYGTSSDICYFPL
ncbi:MAG: hypothetical protein JHC70_25050 [Rhodococcus sp.]|nr:hypothetical protein [Rhodococcus sp. (in: high G+C Gram-positive bacteria)]MBJ7325596.1 hypothetical protein [Rhodococcus sp. (in: high G+C Gram-positive bacteria)]